MNIQSIRTAVESYTADELKHAEADLLEGLPLSIAIEGADEGEQLTHILAATWVKTYMLEHNTAVMPAIREYGKRVRESIS